MITHLAVTLRLARQEPPPTAAALDKARARGARDQKEENDMDVESDDHLFFVPVNASSSGTVALRTGRLVSGERVGLAFTSEESLRAVLGPWQQWTHLCERALRGMLIPIGVEHLRVDPDPAREKARSALEGAEREGAKISGPPGLPSRPGGREYQPAA